MGSFGRVTRDSDNTRNRAAGWQSGSVLFAVPEVIARIRARRQASETEGISHAAKGKGICHAGQCDFLIALPAKSFDSGDSNHDLHILQATRGAEFPLVTVRTRLPEEEFGSAILHADLEIQFAGQTAAYKQVALQLVRQGKDIRISGTIPATLTDFKIDPPSLLAIPIKNDIPVRVEMTWQPQ